MAINPSTLVDYNGQVTAPDANYIYGSARDDAIPGDLTGTPRVASEIKDLQGLQQRLLSEANIIPSGTPDSVLNSQYYDSMAYLFGQQRDTVAALKTLSQTPKNGQLFNVLGATSIGDGGGGLFIFDTSNLSTEVTNDPESGVYVPIATDPTGASGAFVRQMSLNEVRPEWFGGIPDGVTDCTAAMNAACAYLVSTGNRGRVLLSAGTYLVTDTILLGDGNILKGAGRLATNITTPDDIIMLKITGFWSIVQDIAFYKTGTSTVEHIYNLGFGVVFSRNFVQSANNQPAGGYVEADATAYALAVSSGSSGMVDTTDSGQGVQLIEDNVFSQCYVWLTSSDSQFLNNDVWASSDTIGVSQLPHAIRVQNMAAWLIENCDIINAAPSNTSLGYGGGIVIHNAFLGRIYNNYFNPNDKIPGESAPDTMHHISTSHSTGLLNIEIKGNTFRHSYRQGIYTTRLNRCLISNNTFYHGNVADNTYADIDVGGVGNVSGNVIVNNVFDNSLTLSNPGLAINVQTTDTFWGMIKDNTVDGSYLSPYIAWDEINSQSGAVGSNMFQGIEEKRIGNAVINASSTTVNVTFANPLIQPIFIGNLSIVQTSTTGSGSPFKINNFTANGFTIDQVADASATYTYYYKYKLD